MTKLITLDDADISEYDFLDFGAGTGASMQRCADKFGGRGLGIDIDKRKIAEAQAAGEPVVVGDILQLPRQKLVRYVCMDNFLEHLPDFDTAQRMIEVAAAVATDFIFIAHPSFEDEAYLRAIGFKQYWQDWTGHPSHLLVSDLTEMLNRAGARCLNIDFGESTRSTGHAWILPIDAPRDQHTYDATVHGPKATVSLAKPTYREIQITAHLSPDPRVATLEAQIEELRGRRSIRFATALRNVRTSAGARRTAAALREAGAVLRATRAPRHPDARG